MIIAVCFHRGSRVLPRQDARKIIWEENILANIKSAKKRVLTNRKRAERNKAVRS